MAKVTAENEANLRESAHRSYGQIVPEKGRRKYGTPIPSQIHTQKVRVIYRDGPNSRVEDNNGNRFWVRTEDLTFPDVIQQLLPGFE